MAEAAGRAGLLAQVLVTGNIVFQGLQGAGAQTREANKLQLEHDALGGRQHTGLVLLQHHPAQPATGIVLKAGDGIDQAALEAVAEGPWTKVNELVRIDGDLYKRYIAALWSYAEEIQDRFLMALDQEPRNDSLADWRSRVPAGG